MKVTLSEKEAMWLAIGLLIGGAFLGSSLGWFWGAVVAIGVLLVSSRVGRKAKP